jgi:hypothetical protein
MFILARSGQTYARLQLAAGPGATLLLPVRVDWAAWADSLVAHEERMDALTQAWMDEYGQNVRPVIDIPALPSRSRLFDLAPIHPAVIPFDQTRVAHSHVDDPDHIANPEEDWWQIDGELETLVELEAGDYFGTEVLS